MKRLFSLFLLLAAVSLSPAPAQSPDPALTKVTNLFKQGNYREAADLGKEALAKPGASDQFLNRTLDALSHLQANQEQEQVIEDAVKAHPQSWQMLRAAGYAYQGYVAHQGEMVDGQFIRGQIRDWNNRKTTELKDRVRSLQLLEAAWKALPADAAAGDKNDVLNRLSSALTNRRYGAFNAWSMLALTDLTTLPGFDEESGLDSPASGYPVDEKGAPIFFQTPASWAAAQNDGERLRWLQAQRSQLGTEQARQARRELAEIATSWFSVQTLAGYGFHSGEDDSATTKSSIATLHTLKDDETVAKLATGPKRFTLPPEWSFLSIWQSLAEDAEASAYTRVEAWQRVAQELSNRRQHPRAVEALQKALALETDKDRKQSLRTQIEQITGNWGHFESQQSTPAGQEAKLQLVFRNASRVSLAARRVDAAKLLADIEAHLRSEPKNLDWRRSNLNYIGQILMEKNGDKYLSKPVAEWTQDLEPRTNHWDKRVEVPTPLKDAGAYLVEGSFEGGHQARALIWLESTVIVRTSQSNGLHYFVADAVTGAPVPGATLRFFGYRTEWGRGGLLNRERMLYHFKDFQTTTDKDGVVKLTQELDDYQWLTRATTAEGRLAFHGFEYAHFYDNIERFGEQTRLYSITDRPVYRPGQEVKWKAWARQVSYDPELNTNKYAGKSVHVRIYDPRGEEVAMKVYTADGSGAVNDLLSLAEDATLGEYRIEFAWQPHGTHEEHLGQHTFRVEEYKKPEFEVKVDAPEKPVALGDSFEVKVKADYYFGGPVKQGKVKYKVQRSAHTDRWFPMGRWDWLFGAGYGWQATYYDWYPGSTRWCMCIPRWPWHRWQSDPPELVAEGEAPLNADGTFTVKVDTALAKELHGHEDHRYEIDAEVTDQSRRTIFGKGSVLVARRPFEVYVSTDRGYYNAGDSGTVNIHARTLDGREVTASGELVLYRVTYGQDGTPTEEAVHTVKLALTSDKPTAQEKLTFTKGGQYRVAAKLKDAADHEIEGTTFLTVRGQGFNEGRDFRFDDLELLTEKEEYAPGEEVEVTVNTNRPGSTVALFLRAQNSVYPDPIWLKLEGKSLTHRFKLTEADQPNLFIEAYTVSSARVHKLTRQIIVPPKKRIATVELMPDAETYLPGQGSKVKVRVKDVDGKPFTGQVVLTAYDKALEYISGGSNQQDIRPFFWGWKRSHYSQINDSLRHMEARLLREGELSMQSLGAFGDTTMDTETLAFGNSGSARGGTLRLAKSSAAPAAAMMTADAFASGGAPPAPAAPAPMMEAQAAPGGAGGEAGGPEPMIRTNLADSAVWVADFTTDAKGEGELNFNLPENLTTWKLRSWVMGSQTQVGEASVEVITRKNLMVRLQAPRFFVEKDEVVISANVHNEMDVEQQVKAVLELEGGVLEFLEAETKTPAPVKVAAHGEARVDWRVRVVADGEAKIRVKALAQKDADAMEMAFPAYTHGMLKTDSWSLALRPNQASGKVTVKVPAERKPEQSRLEVRYSPTLAMALVDALPYLADYPYGCTEQTLSRFVPTVITMNVLKNLGVDLKTIRDKRTNLNAQEIGDAAKRAKRWQGKDREGKLKEAVFDEDEVMKMAKTGLKRLEAMRNGDGGWGWFPGGRESSPHITALVLHGLKAAQKTGLDVSDGMIRQGLDYLKRHEAEELRRLKLTEKHKEHKSSPDHLDALIHSTLVEHDQGDKQMRGVLYEKRNNLSRYNVALLGLACHTVGEKDRRDMCLRNLRQFLKQDDENQTAWLELPAGGWWYWWDDAIETQAVFLRLLCAVEPKGETAPRIAKYLLNNRRNGTYWNSTKDTAAVIEALADFVQASGESAPQQTVELLVDGKSQTKVEITKDNLFSFNGTFVLSGEDLTTGEHTVELRKLGESPLYANAYLTVFSKEDMIPAAGLEVKARRKFYKLIEEKPDQQVAGSRGQVVTQTGLKYRREEIPSDAPIQSGDLIEVELSIESKNDYEYVLIEDMKPAGFEPVEVRSGWSYDGLTSYQEYRDEKVAFFADRLPRGTHNLRYRVKAEIPGRFSALPTKIEAMYAPELKGNSDEWKAKIVE